MFPLLWKRASLFAQRLLKEDEGVSPTALLTGGRASFARTSQRDAERQTSFTRTDRQGKAPRGRCGAFFSGRELCNLLLSFAQQAVRDEALARAVAEALLFERHESVWLRLASRRRLPSVSLQKPQRPLEGLSATSVSRRQGGKSLAASLLPSDAVLLLVAFGKLRFLHLPLFKVSSFLSVCGASKRRDAPFLRSLLAFMDGRRFLP